MSQKVKIRPLFDKVVVQPLVERELGQKTKGGIFIPETAAKERPEQGIVVAVGPGKKNDNGDLIPVSVKIVRHVEKDLAANYPQWSFSK